MFSSKKKNGSSFIDGKSSDRFLGLKRMSQSLPRFCSSLLK